MNRDRVQSAETLREHDAHCRRIAGQAFSDKIIAELENMAGDYDRDAVRLEDSLRE